MPSFYYQLFYTPLLQGISRFLFIETECRYIFFRVIHKDGDGIFFYKYLFYFQNLNFAVAYSSGGGAVAR